MMTKNKIDVKKRMHTWKGARVNWISRIRVSGLELAMLGVTNIFEKFIFPFYGFFVEFKIQNKTKVYKLTINNQKLAVWSGRVRGSWIRGITRILQTEMTPFWVLKKSDFFFFFPFSSFLPFLFFSLPSF